MSWLSRLSLVQRGLIALMSIVAIAFGAIAIPQLKQQLLPSIELPMVSVLAPYQGASPDVVEKQVIEPLEDGVQGVDGIKSVTSTSSEGSGVIMAQFDYGNDSKRLVADVQQAVNRARAKLPKDVDPQVVSGSTDDIPTVVLAVSSDSKDQQTLADQLNRGVVPDLKNIDGVSQVTVDGVHDRIVAVTPDDKKLAAAGLNAQSLGQALQNGGTSVPAGSFSEDGRSKTVQVGAGFTSVAQIKDLRLAPSAGGGASAGADASAGGGASAGGAPSAGSGPSAGGRPGGAVRLGDVATVKEEQATPTSLTRTNGKPSLAVNVTMDKDGSAVAISDAVKDKLDKIRQDLGKGTHVTVASDQGPQVSKSIDSLTTEGLLGLAMAVIVILVFLLSLRSTLVTAVSIPLSVVITLIVLWTGDLSLNMLTLGALTIAIGRVVDDSIVVLENIKRHLGYGEGASVDDLRRAAEEKEAKSPLQRFYVPVLRFATRRRLTSLGIAVVVLLGTFAMGPLLKTNFLDQGAQDTLTLKQELKPGTSLGAADKQAARVEKVLAANDDIADYQVTVGSSGFMAAFGGGTGANQASYQLKLKDSADSDKVTDALRADLDKLGKSIGDTSFATGGGFGSQDLSVVVKAGDAGVLKTASEQVRKTVAGLDDVTDVQSDLSQSVPRISVKPNAKAAAAGYDQASLGAAVTQAVRGTTSGKAVLGDTERDIVVKSAHPATTEDELKNLTVPTPSGPAKLSTLATVRTVPGPVQMTRIDGARSATVTAKPTGDNTGAVSTQLQQKIDALKLPDGATATIGGVSQDQSDAFSSLGLAMLAAIAIVFMLLVATFRSMIQPMILLVSIPFAATGAIGLLVATGTPLGVPAMIGMLMLIGIVVTNAIVLIDLINQYRSQGYGVVEAVVEGGRHRLRPILMTALATIMALLPMALSITGDGGFISQPLAVVVIGGLITSTLLTLLLVPTLYAMIELRKERRAAKKAAKHSGKNGPQAEENDRAPEPAGV
ncbi:efflux RND transporter permease subunit [Streptomyces angustmyceticus]|uniref:efflux RND transporter permease subunit n=1 Tax=Streptomyces angustmyceticus TaxID=285578 RepID=UPI0021AE5ACC|nr:efflux RND transporter permease subunit [Streptomyces angustmyceticus]